MSVSSAEDLLKSRLASQVSTNSSTSTQELVFDEESRSVHRREVTIFPLFSETAQAMNVPSPIYGFFDCLLLLRYLVCGLWAGSSRCWENETTGPIQIARVIVGLGAGMSESSLLPYSIILLVLALLIAVWHVGIWRSYRTTHLFMGWHLFVSRVIHICLIPLLLPIYATLAGFLLKESLAGATAADGSGVMESVLFATLLIAGLALGLVFYVAYGFACNSPVVMYQALLCSWDPFPVFGMMLVLVWTSFGAPVADLFAPWVTIVFFLIAIVINVFCILRVRFFPFQRWFMNIVFVGFAAGNTVGQLLTLTVVFDSGLAPLVFIPVILVFIVVGAVIAYFLLAKRRRSIVTALSYSSCESMAGRPTEPEKRQYFDSLGLASDSEMIAFLRIGLAEGCELFLDFSFPHFILENRPSRPLTFATAEMLCFFPTELQFFGNCISFITQIGTLSLFDHFLLFQMRKVFVLRQSSLSKEAASMIRKVRHVARDGRSAIRSFWVDIVKRPQSLTFPALVEIHGLINRISSEFRDLADQYANSQDICNEYASFLIEGAGDFTEAFKWKGRAQLIEQGIRLDKDVSFRSLMNLYPDFLLSGTFDDRGNCLLGRGNESRLVEAESQNSGSFAGMASSSAGSTTNALKNTDLDEVGRNAIHAMTLRVRIGEVITSMVDLNAKFLWKTIALIHGVSVLIGFVILVLGPAISSSSNSYLAILHQMTLVDQDFGLSLLASGLAIGSDSWYKSWNGLKQLEQQTKISSPDELLVSGDPVSAVWRLSRLARRSFLAMFNALIAGRASLPNAAEIAASDLRYAGVVPVPAPITMTGHGVLIEGLDQSAMGVAWSQTKGYIDEDYATHFLGWIRWFEGVVNLVRSLKFMTALRDGVLTDGHNMFATFRQLFTVLQVALPIIAGLIFLFFTIRSWVQFGNGMKLYFAALLTVSAEVVERSLLPISKGVKRERMNNGSSQLVKRSGWQIKVYPVLIGFAIVANCVAFGGAFAMAIGNLNQIDWLFSWYLLAEQRMISMTSLPALISITASSPHGNAEHPLHLELYSWLLDEIAELERTRVTLLVGDEETGLPALAGFDEALDKNELLDVCEAYPIDMHDFMRCMSVNRASSEVAILLRTITSTGDPERLCYRPFCNRLAANETDFSVLVIIVDGGLAMRLVDYGESMLDFADARFAQVVTGLVVIGIVLLLVNCILFATNAFLLTNIGHSFEGLKTLLRLLPPKDLLADPHLVHLIIHSLSGYREPTDAIRTPAEIVMDREADAVVALNLEYIIENVNAAFREVTGMSADEAIGQRLSLLFPVTEEGEATHPPAALYERLEQLKIGATKDVSSVIVQCQTSAGCPLAVDILVVPHMDGGDRLVSFSLLLRDLSKQATAEEKSREARVRCERVIQTLMPIEVYAGLAEGSTAFTSATATVFSLEITGLFENVSSYAPSQILDAISAVYDLFDEIVSLHPCVRRVRYGGNDILACCGLFDYADRPEEQVEHAALVCLEFASHREEISEKLAMEMDITAGIAFGGPLIGNVLNTESPRFDLSGTIVGEAIEIRQNAAPGAVRVTASVQGMLKPYMFDFTAVQVPGLKVSGVFEITLKEEPEEANT